MKNRQILKHIFFNPVRYLSWFGSDFHIKLNAIGKTNYIENYRRVKTKSNLKCWAYLIICIFYYNIIKGLWLGLIKYTLILKHYIFTGIHILPNFHLINKSIWTITKTFEIINLIKIVLQVQDWYLQGEVWNAQQVGYYLTVFCATLSLDKRLLVEFLRMKAYFVHC